MSKVCELTGKRFMTGNAVSHANNKTKRKFDVILQPVSYKSDILKQTFKMKIAASTIRTVSKYGGFDRFLIKSAESKLSNEALKIKRKISKKLSPKK